MLFSKNPTNIFRKEAKFCFMTKYHFFAKKKIFPFTFLKKSVD